MKRKTYTILAFAAMAMAAAMQSCSYDFGLGGVDSEQRLFLNCFPSNSGYLPVALYVSQPVGMDGKIPPQAGGAGIVVEVNGENRPVKVNEGELSGVQLGMKYIDGSLSSGDKVSIMAEMDGVRRIESETVVPDAFPEYSVTLRKLSEDYLEVRIRYKLGEKGYYGVQIFERETVVADGEQVSRYTYPIWPEGESDRVSSLSNTGDLKYTNFDDAPLMIWEDGVFTGSDNTGEYSVKIRYKAGYDGSSGLGSVEGSAEVRYDYSLKLYRLSAEAFRYFYAIIAADSNTLSIMGLSPPVLSYSNVKGGYGVLGGMHVTESGWFAR